MYSRRIEMKLKKCMAVMMAALLSVSMAACGALKDKGSEKEATTPKQTEKITEAPTEEPTTEEPFVPTSLNIKMVGDMLMHDSVSRSGVMSDGSISYDHFFVHVKDELQSADICMVNQEVMIGGEELGITGYPTFNCRYEVGDALVNAGFNVVLHATNHTIDKGAKGVDNCINYWETKHPEIAYIGINKTAEDVNDIYVFEQDGIKVAILNYTYGTNGIPLPAGREYIVNMLDEERIKSDLKKADEMADFVIVCPHWGPEYKHEPWNEPGSIYDQVGWAKIMADNGADLILAAHPHVIQPVEWIEGANGNKTLCYWSLGNFISAQDEGPRMVGAMADVTIENNENGEVFIKEYGVIPLVTQKLFGSGLTTTYKLSDYTDELAGQNKIKVECPQFSVEYCKELCRKVFGDLYKEK